MSVRAPKHLGKQSAAWFRRVMQAYEIEPSLVSLAVHAAECLDIVERADATVRELGPYQQNRNGEWKQHPAVNTARDHRALFCRLVKQLGLLNSAEDHRGRPTDWEIHHGD